MGHLVSVTGSDAEYIKKLIVVIAQTQCNAVEAVVVTTVETVVLQSMIEATAEEPETAVSIMGSVANLEHPLSGGLGWTENDLKENVLELEADDLDEKIINHGVEAKRFKVRAWGGVHMSQSGQENPGAQCGDKDSDVRRIDNEECVVKDWRHTHTNKQCQAKRRNRYGCNSKGGRSHGMFYTMRAAMK